MRSTRTSKRSATRATMTTTAQSARLSPGRLIADQLHGRRNQPGPTRPKFGTAVLTWAFPLERVTGIEPVLSAWGICPVLRIMIRPVQG